MNDQSSRPSLETDVDVLIDDVERIAVIFDSWDEGQRSVVQGFRRAIDALHKEALRKLIGAMKTAPEGLDILRATAQDPVVYTVLRYHGLLRPSLQERIEQALDSVRPVLATHGGNVELVAIAPPDSIEVRFLGNCDNCPSSTLTFVAGVKQAIEQHCPEIKNIRQVKSSANGGSASLEKVAFTSPFQEAGDIAWTFVAPLAAVPDGGVAAFKIGDRAIFLSRTDRLVTGFENACPHLGMRLANGWVEEGRITCPHHGFVFDLMSGACLTVPQLALTQHAVRLIGDRIEIGIRS